MTKIIPPNLINLVTPKARAKRELLFNKPAPGVQQTDLFRFADWSGAKLIFFSVFFFFLDERFETDTIGVHYIGPAKNEMSNLLLGASFKSPGGAFWDGLGRIIRFIRRVSVQRRESVVETPPSFVEFSCTKCQTSLELAQSDDSSFVILL